jgi:hypothetical protein
MKLSILDSPFRICQHFAKKLSAATLTAIAKKVPEKWRNFLKCIFSTQNKKNITVESLQSPCIHTMSHWSSGLPVCFPS